MNILLICKLSNSKLTGKLVPMLKSTYVDKIYILRDSPGTLFDSKVVYISGTNTRLGKFRHFKKIFKGINLCKKVHIGAIIGILNTPHGYIGRIISMITHIPYIHMTIAGDREFWINGKVVERFNIFMFKSGSAITVTGNQTKNYLLRKGFDEKKIFILPNLPNEKFVHIPLKETRYYDIISFSRIDKNKNIILLIKALAWLKEKYTLKILIVGDGEELKNIKQTAVDYGVNDMITFLGYVDKFEEKVRLLSNSKIFISCSKGEGFPVSLLEAMCCGCVPVVSNVGDISDVIENGANGYMYDDTNDESEFTKCLESLLSSPSGIVQFRHNAYNIKDKISIARNVEIWNNLLQFVSK